MVTKWSRNSSDHVTENVINPPSCSFFKTRNDVVSSPAISNGVVYIGSDHGHVYARE